MFTYIAISIIMDHLQVMCPLTGNKKYINNMYKSRIVRLYKTLMQTLMHPDRRNLSCIIQIYDRTLEMLNVHISSTYLLNIKMILKKIGKY